MPKSNGSHRAKASGGITPEWRRRRGTDAGAPRLIRNVSRPGNGENLRIPSERRFGAATVIGGALLLVIYAGLFPFVLPIDPGQFDYVTIVASPWWLPLTGSAMASVLLLLVGLDSVYATLRPTAGISAWLGFLVLKVALVLQACKLTWQLLLDPAIAKQPAAQFLFRDAVFLTDAAIGAFRLCAAATIVVGVALFGTALFRSGLLPRAAVGLVGLGAVAYAAGFLLSIYLAVGGIITLGIGCALIGRALWGTERTG